MNRIARYGHYPRDVRHSCVIVPRECALSAASLIELDGIRARHARPVRSAVPSTGVSTIPPRLAGAIALFGLLPFINIGAARRQAAERKPQPFSPRRTGKALANAK